MKKIKFIFLFSIAIFLSCSCNKYNNKKKYYTAKDGSVSEFVVINSYDNNNPKDGYFYKLDKNGNKTEAISREVHFYPDKKKYIEGDIKNGLRDGQWYAYFDNEKSTVQTSAFYVDGVEDGKYIVYYETGKAMFTGNYNKGICSGKWIFYTPSGKVAREISADDNTIACGSCKRCITLKNSK